MSDTKKSIDLTNDALITDALLRLRTIENLLVAKGIVTQDEYVQELNTVSNAIMKEILKKANVPGDLDELINTLNSVSNS